MNWTNLWMELFGKDQLLGLNLGFWVSMTVVVILVVAMNAIFWNMKPITTSSSKS